MDADGGLGSHAGHPHTILLVRGGVMTPAQKDQAIEQLSARIGDFIIENREAHKEIKVAIEKITTHCALREEEVDTRLKEREAKVDKQFANHETHMREEICGAQEAAVLEAKKPSEGAQARRWLARAVYHGLTLLALFLGILLTVLSIMGKL